MRKRLHDEVAVAQVKRILRGEHLVQPAADVREAAIHLALAIELAHIKIIADAQRDDGVAPARVLAHEAFERAAVEQPRAVLEELLGVLLAKIIPQTDEQAGIARRIKDGLLRHEAERQQQDPRADDERKRAVAPERRILPLPVKHQEHCLNRNEVKGYPVVTIPCRLVFPRPNEYVILFWNEFIVTHFIKILKNFRENWVVVSAFERVFRKRTKKKP